MVHLETLIRLRTYLKNNLENYCKEHPSEYILLEPEGLSGIKETFYKTQKELSKATAKYEGMYGPTFLPEKIPKKSTHRFNKDNKPLEFRLDKYVTKCPNDNKTMLEIIGPLECTHIGKQKRYSQWTQCPDCACRVERKPSEKSIKEHEKRMKETIFC
jgi:hypothetical protein